MSSHNSQIRHSFCLRTCTKEHAQLQTACYIVRAHHECDCGFRRARLDCGPPEEFEPTLKMDRLDCLEPHVGHHWIALVAARHQHHRRPEIAHLCQMLVPVLANHARKDWPNERVQAHLCIEVVDNFADHRLVHARFVDDLLNDLGAALGTGRICFGHGADIKKYFIYLFRRENVYSQYLFSYCDTMIVQAAADRFSARRRCMRLYATGFEIKSASV